MVTEALLVILAASARGLFALVPAVDIGLGLFEQAYQVGTWFTALNRYVPMGAVIGVLFMLLALKLFLFGWRVVIWIYHQFWGSS